MTAKEEPVSRPTFKEQATEWWMRRVHWWHTFQREHYPASRVIAYFVLVFLLAGFGYLIIQGVIAPNITLRGIDWDTVAETWVAEMPVFMLLPLILGDTRRSELEEKYERLELALRVIEEKERYEHLSVHRLHFGYQRTYDDIDIVVNKDTNSVFKTPEFLTPLILADVITPHLHDTEDLLWKGVQSDIPTVTFDRTNLKEATVRDLKGIS